MDELHLTEDQIVTPLSVDELAKVAPSSQAAALLRRHARVGARFYAKPDGEIMFETPSGRTHSIDRLGQSVAGIGERMRRRMSLTA